uniref:Uncharacterized protein n=1 Tax=Physcomitrium patens TaxID=3218 RepID=A0A2K1JRN7_PHYPA|nr:hypothetical protein PHYPA_016582 [Physcomitrium patens]
MVLFLNPQQFLSRTAICSDLQRRWARINTAKKQPLTGVGARRTQLRPSQGIGGLQIRSLNTFLPYPEFDRTVECLDNRRLGKQRVEAMQILRIVQASPVPIRGMAWANAPVVRMWRGFPGALAVYYNACLEEWGRRGFKNIVLQPADVELPVVMPPWLGDELVHASHRSNLLRKEPEHYLQFGWTESPDLPYVWPVPLVRVEVTKVEISDSK